MKTALNRMKNILLKPGHEWLAIKDEAPKYREIFKHAAILAAIPTVAAMAVRILFFNQNIRDNALTFSIGNLLLTNLTWYGMYILDIVITGMIIAAVLSTSDRGWSGIRGFTIAAYSFTPLSLAGCTAVMPYLGWTLYPAILYGIYLTYLGITLLAEIPKKKAAWFALSSFSAAAVIVGMMNLFEYVVESFLVSKIFS
jgi:Yip1 domain